MHLFRKYINNRGSALFMVISTMTAVMVSCMAMYFSVVSSRSAQYAVFNQQQSKQAAISISDAVLAGMMDGSNPALTSLIGQMWNLSVGEKLTTNANGFSAFDPSATGEDDPNIGSYMVEITRISENTFDIVVTSSVNGVSDVFHSVIELEMSQGADAPPAPTQVFAATGYVPNDVYLNNGVFVTDVFFDNEVTYVQAYRGGAMQLYGNLSTGGSLIAHQWLENKGSKPAIYAIRGNYEAYFGGPVTFSALSGARNPGEGDRNIVMIGGNAYVKPLYGDSNAGMGFTNADVYILGDLTLDGASSIGSNVNYFVNGNLIVKGGKQPDLSNVRLTGTLDLSQNNSVDIPNKPMGSWGTEEGFSTKKFMSKAEMVTLLDERTQTNEYYKWEINDSNPDGDKYVAELNESVDSSVHKKTLKYYKSGDKLVSTITLKYNDDPTKNGGYIEKGCVIEDIQIAQSGNWFSDCTLIIDTGDSEDNVYTIRVKANQDFDLDDKNETFLWLPRDTVTSPWGTYSNYQRMHVFVKGRGSVVIDVPKGVTYQDQTDADFMHYNWAVLGGLKVDTSRNPNTDQWNEEGKYWESAVVYQPNGFKDNMDSKFKQWIHTSCFHEEDESGNVTTCGCSYTEKKSASTCTACSKELMVITCSVHGELNSFCPDCQSSMAGVDKEGKPDAGAHYGECLNHVGRTEIDKYLASHSDIKNQMNKDAASKIIYPTTNIYLVSCDESANIRLSDMEKSKVNKTASDCSVQQNSFFGYIYAPYMTFKGLGHNTGGSFLRIMGGMTVSDYIIEDSTPYMSCWPEKMPTDLMSDECRKNKLAGVASKSWKINLTGH